MAVGQEPEPNVTVKTRPRPDFDPLGIRAGAFLVNPEVTVLGAYSDNIALDEEDEQSDFEARFQPSVAAASTWSRHALGVAVGADIARHLEEDDEDFEDLFATANGRLDIGRANHADTELRLEKGHQGRDDVNDQGDDELADRYSAFGSLGYTHAINRLTFEVRGTAERVDVDDGVGNLDGNIYNVFLRPGFQVSPRVNVFTEGRYNVDARDNEDLESDGYELRVGAALDLTAKLFGEAFAGYRIQDLNSGEESGASFGVNMNWNPTQLTSIGLTGQRDFVPAAEGDAESNFQTAIGLTVDHEVRRNLILGTEAEYIIDDLDDGREDDTIALGAGLTYLLNRNLSLEGGYRFSDRSSNAAGEDFTENRFTVGFTARL
jgi:hypothetical protein